MKTMTTTEAYDQGYNEAMHPSLSSPRWPHESDFNNPDKFVKAYMDGYDDGERDKHRNDMSGCHS